MPDQLLVIDVVMSRGDLLLQTVWATEPDRLLGGRRRTDIEAIGDQATLMCRLPSS